MTADLWIELVGRARVEGIHTLESLFALAGLRAPKPARRRIQVVELPA